MRIQRDQFTALLKTIWGRDYDRTRAIALQICAHNAKDERLKKDVTYILGHQPVVLPPAVQGLVRIQEPSTEPADLVLASEVRRALDAVVTEHAYAEELTSRGLAPITRLLFHGPSGTGKTSAAAALAHELDRPLYVIPMDALISSYLGESSSRLRKALEFVSQQEAVVLLDEIDAIGLARGGQNEVGEQGRIVTTLLVVLDDLRRQRSRTVLIASTNRRDALDSALGRRFDLEVGFALPTMDERREVAARVFDRAGLVGPGLSGAVAIEALGVSHAEVERWALGEAKRLVMESLGEKRGAA